MTAYSTSTREVPIDSLVIDPSFAGLFIEEPDTVRRIARDMRANGFDPHRPIDVWRDGAGRGRHVVLEGHQRLSAAKAARLEKVRIAYRSFSDPNTALLWAAEQQANRRNASREAQCLSILRALDRAGELEGSRADLSRRFGFGDATVGRALQVLNRGTESEIVAVLEGKHGLKTAYELILAREREEAQAFAEREHDDPDRDVDRDPDRSEDEGEYEEEAPEALAQARDLTHTLAGRVDRLLDLLGAEPADALLDVRNGRHRPVLEQINGSLEDVKQALGEMEAS
jgi:ParB family chromosome partitioning protein